MNLSVGGRGLLHATSMVKVLLAHLEDEKRDLIVESLSFEQEIPNSITDINEFRRELERTNQRGYGIADCEHELHIRSIAVPILDASQFANAALCLAGPNFRLEVDDLQKHVPLLQHAVQEIGARVG